jgi:hypothetical protein
MEEHQVIREELLSILDRYAKGFEKQNEGQKLSFSIRTEKRPTAEKFYKSEALLLEIIENGVARVLLSKTMNFRHPEHYQDTVTWMPILYHEFVYELIGSGIAANQFMWEHKNKMV